MRAIAAAAVAIGALASGCQAWGCDPDFERMQNQARADVYEDSAEFAAIDDDSRVMRAPPEGTVPRERVLGPAGFATGSELGAYLARVPVPLTRALVDRGRQRFEIVCATCHGIVGDGESKVAENMRLRRPPSFHEDKLRAYPPGRIFEVIGNGYGLMPAFDWHITIADRWAIAAYVKALQLSQSANLTALSDEVRREAVEALR